MGIKTYCSHFFRELKSEENWASSFPKSFHISIQSSADFCYQSTVFFIVKALYLHTLS